MTKKIKDNYSTNSSAQAIQESIYLSIYFTIQTLKLNLSSLMLQYKKKTQKFKTSKF